MFDPALILSASISAVKLDMWNHRSLPFTLFLFFCTTSLSQHAIAEEYDSQADNHSGDYSGVGDDDNRSFRPAPRDAEPPEPTFDDSPSEALDQSVDDGRPDNWKPDRFLTPEHKDQEKEVTTVEPQKKNIFIYVPFRPNFRKQQQTHTPLQSVTTTTTTTPKPRVSNPRPTSRTTFSSPWPPADSPSLRSISRSTSESKELDKWKPLSGLRESASSSYYSQAVPPILQTAPQLVQSPPQFVQSAPLYQTAQVVQEPQQQVLLQSPPQLSPPQQVVHTVQQTQPVNDVRFVEAVPQQQPVQVSVVQGPPSPVQLNIVRSPPQQQPVQVNFVRSQPLPVLAAPIVQHRFVQAAPVQTQVLQAPIFHTHPVLHAVPAPIPFAPAFGPVVAAPPCPTALLSAAIPPLHRHTFFSAPQAQRTRTVLQQVQFVPEQTHVYTTTSYSPATRTTVYESDHVAAFSAPKPSVVKAPAAARVLHHSPTALLTDREGPATVYTFPKMRILGAPIRIVDRLSSRRQLRQRLREERLKEKHTKQKEKKIFVFNRRSSS